MKLVIAEKPSVAMSLAAVLGANEKKDGYLEGDGYLVSWCVGHLLELAQPEAYGEQYAKWHYGDLPILPEEWKYEVPKDKKKQLIPTEKGTNLILVLPDNIKSPILTAEWESMLKQVERGELAAESFMEQIADMSRTQVKEHTAPEERFAGLFPDAKRNGREAVGTCPRCGGPSERGPHFHVRALQRKDGKDL